MHYTIDNTESSESNDTEPSFVAIEKDAVLPSGQTVGRWKDSFVIKVVFDLIGRLNCVNGATLAISRHFL